jgi:hypothetical protein
MSEGPCEARDESNSAREAGMRKLGTLLKSIPMA